MTMWTPAAQTSGIEVWLPPTSGNFTLSGSNVSTWKDKSGNGRDFPLVSGATAPVYGANAGGTGYPGVTFAGGGALQNSSLGVSTVDLAFFTVASTGSSNGNGARLLGIVNSSGHDDYNSGIVALADYGGGGTVLNFQTNAGSTANGGFTAGQLNLLASIFDGTTGYLWENGTSLTSGSAPISTYGWSGYGAMAVGGWVNENPFNPWFGVVCEVLVVDQSILSATCSTEASGKATVQQCIEGYLAWNNGTQASLPSGHPFTSAAPVLAGGGTTTQALFGLMRVSVSGAARLNAGAQLAAKTKIQASGKASIAATTSLAGRGSLQVRGRATITGSAAIKGLLRGFIASRATMAPKAVLSGTGKAITRGQATMSPKAVMSGVLKSATSAQASISARVAMAGASLMALQGRLVTSGPIIALLGAMSSRFRGTAAISAAAKLSGQGKSQFTARAMPSFFARMGGAVRIQTKGLSSISGKVAMTGQSLAATFGRASPPGSILLVGRLLFSLSGRATMTVRTALSGSMKTQLQAASAPSFVKALAGLGKMAMRSSASLMARASLSGTARAKTVGQAGVKATTSLSGQIESRTSAKATLSVRTALSGATKMVVQGLATISVPGIYTIVQVSGASLMRLTGRAWMSALYASASVVKTATNNRTVAAEQQSRTVTAEARNTTVSVPPND